ncbi:DUF2812 domain-containing protein [Oscillibacter sp.]|uniref:DUF2812 domain-containing protein n=1 Tax=Oscillibacter sp. TaxID=1945593 RepID=UPI0028B1CAAF|nr:DUF2812 domain-containing protein [Oscillibacter sp.]
MSKTVFRYFFDFLDGQKKWLNSMAEQGYRLKKSGRMTYTFDDCNPNEYEYTVEFIAEKSYSKGKDYRGYLESMGFRTFTKNINLNFSYGKIKWRPYAKGMGQIATSPGGFNKELLILEKKRDGKPFELHTDVRDKLDTYKTARRAYVWAVLLMFGLTAITFVPDSSSVSIPMTWVIRTVILFFGILFAIPTVKYSSLVNQLKEESKTFE